MAIPVLSRKIIFFRRGLLTLALLYSATVVANAQMLLTRWELRNVTHNFIGTEPIEFTPPWSGELTVLMPLSPVFNGPHHQYTTTEFGVGNQTLIQPPVGTPVEPDLNDWTQYAATSRTFAYVLDLPEFYTEEVAAHVGNYYSNAAGTRIWAVERDFRMWAVQIPGIDGTGAAAYNFTAPRVVDFVRGFWNHPDGAYFHEAFFIRDIATGERVSGAEWTSYVHLKEIQIISPVPEPTTFGLGAALAAVVAIAVRRVQRHGRASAARHSYSPRVWGHQL